MIMITYSVPIKEHHTPKSIGRSISGDSLHAKIKRAMRNNPPMSPAAVADTLGFTERKERHHVSEMMKNMCRGDYLKKVSRGVYRLRGEV